MSADLGVPIVTTDARNLERPMTDGGVGLTDTDYGRIMASLEQPGVFSGGATREISGRIEPPKTILEWPYVGPAVSVFLLLVPAALAVWFATSLAEELDPIVGAAFDPAVMWAATLPEALSTMARQAGAAIGFAIVIAWGGRLLVG